MSKAPTRTSLLAATAQHIMKHRKSSLIIQDGDAASFLSLLTRMNSKEETPEQERRASEASFSLLLDHSLDFLDGFDEKDEAKQLEDLLASGEEEDRDGLDAATKMTWV